MENTVEVARTMYTCENNEHQRVTGKGPSTYSKKLKVPQWLK